MPPLPPALNQDHDQGCAVILSEVESVTKTERTRPRAEVVRRWWVCAGDPAFATALAARATSQSEPCVISDTTTLLANGDSDIAGLFDSDLARVRQDGQFQDQVPLPTDVVFLGMAHEQANPLNLPEQTTRLVGLLQSVVQRLAHSSSLARDTSLSPRPIRLWIITRDAQSPNLTPQGLMQAGLWGFARTAAQEYPHWLCRLIDLDAEASDESAVQAMLDEVSTSAADAENETRFRQGVRQVRRLLQATASAQPPQAMGLQVATRGTLAGLRLMKLCAVLQTWMRSRFKFMPAD